jgi:hypothetical protein
MTSTAAVEPARPQFVWHANEQRLLSVTDRRFSLAAFIQASALRLSGTRAARDCDARRLRRQSMPGAVPGPQATSRVSEPPPPPGEDRVGPGGHSVPAVLHLPGLAHHAAGLVPWHEGLYRRAAQQHLRNPGFRPARRCIPALPALTQLAPRGVPHGVRR